MKGWRKSRKAIAPIVGALLASVLLGAGSVLADEHNGDDGVVVVTPSDPQGWCWTPPCADTRPGGEVNFVSDPTAPGSPHRGALQLTTDATTTAKAQAVHGTNTPLADVNELSYWTRQVSGSPLVADPAYQLAVCLNGATATGCAPNLAPPPAGASSFTTLVFEPYQGGLGPIVPNVWQRWQVDAGLFWSTRTVGCSGGVVLGTPGGPANYTLAMIKTMCPNALVFQFIVNVGSNNPLYDVYTDLFNFNGTTYNFEPAGGDGDDDDGDDDDGDDDDGDDDDGDDDDG